MELKPDRMLAHYRLIEKIGEGGMGVVWRAADTTLDREVAIKVLPEAFASNPDLLARFEREAKVLASLNHPNIASVYSVGEVEGLHFLAMELVAGENLGKRLTRAPLSTDEGLFLARQIAEALETAHESGVIHRDLKPGNIQITPDGKAKVLDFGLSKAVERAATASGSGETLASPTVTSLGTAAGVILGTATYMSPEQARGKPLDRRTDVWSLGCVLYEMFSSRRPFDGETVTDVLGAILHREPDWEALPRDLPAPLNRLIRRCLRRDPKQRLRDAGDARIVIEDLLSGDAGVIEGSEAETRPARRGRPLLVGAVALLAVVVGFAVGWSIPRESADPPLRKFDIPLDRDPGVAAGATDVALSPDGRHLVWEDRGQLWLRELSNVGSRPLPGTEDAIRPFWSPDSRWVGFLRDRRIEKIDRTGGEPVLVGVLPREIVFGAGSASATWGEDGKIVIGPGGEGLHQVPAQGGDVTPLLDTIDGEADYHRVAALPDGRGWIFVVHRSSPAGIDTVGVATPEGERRTVVTFPDESVSHPAYSATGHVLFERTGAAPGIWAVPFSAERLETTGEPFLVAAGAKRPSASAEGTLAYQHGVGARRARLLWLDRDGKRLAEIGEPLESLYPFPELSADDSRVLVAGRQTDAREAWVYDTVSGERRQLSFGGISVDMAMWHPDERRVLYYTVPGWSIRSVMVDGSSEERMVTEGIMPRVTSDGSQLVFAKSRPDTFDWDIWIRPLDGGTDTEKALIMLDGIQWFPVLSPDERFLCYTSNETGQDEIYIASFPDGERRRRISSGGGAFGRWRRDGRELYYAKDDGIVAIPMNPETQTPTGSPRTLFRRPVTGWSDSWDDGFDVAADGSRFIVAENVVVEDETSPSIRVVQNWTAEFEGGDN